MSIGLILLKIALGKDGIKWGGEFTLARRKLDFDITY